VLEKIMRALALIGRNNAILTREEVGTQIYSRAEVWAPFDRRWYMHFLVPWWVQIKSVSVPD
jgi:hypothetical protein